VRIPKSRELVRYGSLAGGLVSGVVSSVAVGAVIGKRLGVEQLGLFAFIGSIGDVAGAIARFGLPQLISREAARHFGANPENAGAFRLRNSLATLWMTVPTALATGAVAAAIWGFSLRLLLMLVLGICNTLLLTIYAMLQGVLRGAGKFLRSEVTLSTTELLGAVLAITVVVAGGSLVDVLVAILSVRLVTTVSLAIASRQFVQFGGSNRDVGTPWQRLLSSAPFAVENLFILIILRSDSLIVAATLGARATAIYEAATAIPLRLHGVCKIFSDALYPDMARAAIDDRTRWGLLSARSCKLSYLSGLGAALTVFALSRQIIERLYGPGFEEAIGLMMLASAYVPLRSAAYSLESTLLSDDHERKRAQILGGTMALNLICTAFLVPTVGLQGALYATLGAEAIKVTLLIGAMRRHARPADQSTAALVTSWRTVATLLTTAAYVAFAAHRGLPRLLLVVVVPVFLAVVALSQRRSGAVLHPQSASKPRRFAELDSLRAFAALGVVVYHYTARYSELFITPIGLPRIEIGAFGVLFFFALSGYVVFPSMQREAKCSEYLRRRALRILPLYWVGILVTASVTSATKLPGRSAGFTAIILNFTMLNRLAHAADVDGAYWSLHLEVGCYLALLGLWRVRRRRLQLDRTLELTAWMILVGAVTAVSLVASHSTSLLAYPAAFLAGVLLCRYAYAANLSTVLAIGALLVATFFLLGLTGAGVLIAAIVLIRKCTTGGIRILRNRFTVALGGSSYALYLLHQNIGYVALRYLYKVGMPWPVAIASTICALMVFSHFVTTTVDGVVTRLSTRSTNPHPKNTLIAQNTEIACSTL
jgi:peptidoglycan/LPS O-acetylase OafA/YrhL/O-antigen/teichoic acid export membrane protein